MNVLSLFDGMSCCRLALDRAGIKYDKYYASEVDKFAMQVASANYPDTIQLGDVRDVTRHDVEDIGLLAGGSPCFVAGTKVLTKKGYVDIEKIVVGDEVLTHKGRFRSVLSVGGEVKDTIEVYAQGFKKTVTTANHPYYCREMTREWDNNNRTSVRELDDPMFKKAGKLVKDDFLATPIIEIEENPRNLDIETCWILGRYLADGHYRKDKRKGRKNSYQYQLILSIGKDKVDGFPSKVKSRHYSFYPHTQSVYRAVFSSMELVNLVIDIGVGKGAKNKTIPTEILLLPVEHLHSFLEGYVSGDGYSSKEGVFNATSISEELIMGLSLVSAKVYGTCATFHHCIRSKTCVIEGRTVNQNDTFSTQFRDHMSKQSKSITDQGFVWSRFKKSIPTGLKERVYNLEVEEDNTYTANNAVVHNCQNFSFAGNQKGMSTTDNLEVTSLSHYLELKNKGFEFVGQSYLFWEYVRLLYTIQPKYFLLENVNMTKKWQQVLTKALKDNYHGDVYMYDINSNLVSAQSRRRLYWTNIPDVPQPEDRGILLKDILDSPGLGVLKDHGKYREKNDKSNCIDANYFKGADNHGQRTMIGINYSSSGRGDGKVEARFMIDPEKAQTLTKGGYGTRSLTGVIESNVDVESGIFHETGKCTSTKSSTYKLEDMTIRKLTPVECERLQTVDTGYTGFVSDSQRYKMLGNGWTVDAIAHILSYGNFTKELNNQIDECTLL